MFYLLILSSSLRDQDNILVLFYLFWSSLLYLLVLQIRRESESFFNATLNVHFTKHFTFKLQNKFDTLLGSIHELDLFVIYGHFKTHIFKWCSQYRRRTGRPGYQRSSKISIDKNNGKFTLECLQLLLLKSKFSLPLLT